MPTGIRYRRARARFRVTLWVIPMVYAIGAIVLAAIVLRLDSVDPVDFGPNDIDPSSASTALAALGSGMIVFTGFVTSVVLMIVQFGSTQFSPRFLRWFRTEPTLKHALGTFIATFLFALISTAFVGHGDDTMVPYRALFVSLVLALASVLWFLVLVARTSDNLRVAHVTQRVNADSREVFDLVYPESHQAVRAASDAIVAMESDEPVQILRMEGVGQILQSFDRTTLVRLARVHHATIELKARVGDHVPSGGTLIEVYAPVALPEHQLRTSLFFGDERTIEDDPAFGFRLLVDVAIRALSPAVNDPTTAVQSLHRIEDMLRYASSKYLSVGVVTDDDLHARLIYPTPSWNDLVTLALDEIRAFGAGQYQISRRLRALIVDLIADLPEERQPALRRQLELLELAVEKEFPDPLTRADALLADRQGLGLGREVHITDAS
jgi:uncharacterized membrane protein